MPIFTKSILRKMIADGDTAQALDVVLQTLAQEHKDYNKFIQLSGQWKTIKEKINLDLIDHKTAHLGQNRITNSTLEFIETLPESLFTKVASKSPSPRTIDLVSQVVDINTNTFTYDLFFSFSNLDIEDARLICDALRGYGLRVFFSADDMRTKGGHQFSEVIDDALETSRHFLLYCTSNAMQSDWVRKEYRTFHDMVHIYDQKNRRFLVFEGNNFDIKWLPITYRNNQRVCNTDEIIYAILSVQPNLLPKAISVEKEKIIQELVQAPNTKTALPTNTQKKKIKRLLQKPLESKKIIYSEASNIHSEGAPPHSLMPAESVKKTRVNAHTRFAGVAILGLLVLLFVWFNLKTNNEKLNTTSEILVQGTLPISHVKVDTPAYKSPQNNSMPSKPSAILEDTQSVKTSFSSSQARKPLQPNTLSASRSVPQDTQTSSTSKGNVVAMRVDDGRFAVRAGTYSMMEGARLRLEEVIKLGYTNAEITKTSSGKAAVVVFRSNDKNAAIRVVDKLEAMGIDAAVFDRSKKD